MGNRVLAALFADGDVEALLVHGARIEACVHGGWVIVLADADPSDVRSLAAGGQDWQTCEVCFPDGLSADLWLVSDEELAEISAEIEE